MYLILGTQFWFVTSPRILVPRFVPSPHFLVPRFVPSPGFLVPSFVPSPGFLVPTITRNLKKNSLFRVKMIFFENFHMVLGVTRHAPFIY